MKRARLASAIVAATLALGCGGDDGQTAELRSRCAHVLSAVCAKYVECHVVEQGAEFTDGLCASNLPAVTEECVASGGVYFAAATQDTVDACADAFAAVPCTDVCGQLPPVPSECAPLHPSQGTTAITCQ
jgi:hypothetical protein